MKALKLTVEVPLNDKTHVSDMRLIGEQAAEFKKALEDNGFKDITVAEAVVSRPGRG